VTGPRIHIAPVSEPGLEDAVARGGGSAAPAEEADGVIWINPRDPEGLKELLSRSPARWVQLPFAGIESFFAAGVIDPALTWTCAKGIYGHACAEHALALMLAGSRRLAHHARAKRWDEPGFGSPERRLKGATLLIVGMGGIGRALAEIVGPLEMRVIGTSRSGRAVDGVEVHRSSEMGSLLGDADYVAVCAALTDETRGLIGKDELGAMKSEAWLVNVARGGLVDTDALVGALRDGEIAGAALDVTDPEPLPPDHELWSMDQVLITPHVANTWDMALPELRDLVRRNVENLASGSEMEGLVDPQLGY
jgi:phosphoglycerate dehydrogenase-like enzyme